MTLVNEREEEGEEEWQYERQIKQMIKEYNIKKKYERKKENIGRRHEVNCFPQVTKPVHGLKSHKQMI
jgi:hypothetical protein